MYSILIENSHSRDVFIAISSYSKTIFSYNIKYTSYIVFTSQTNFFDNFFFFHNFLTFAVL